MDEARFLYFGDVRSDHLACASKLLPLLQELSSTKLEFFTGEFPQELGRETLLTGESGASRGEPKRAETMESGDRGGCTSRASRTGLDEADVLQQGLLVQP
jgi:hypothetical protein